MTEFFNWLSENLVATTALIIAFSTIVMATTLIFVVAFFQGRSISFWPPQIGEKRTNTSVINNTNYVSRRELSQYSPILKKGTEVKSFSGETYTIETIISGSSSATLFRAVASNKNLVVIKLYWQGWESPHSYEMFEREIALNEGLLHRNIVKILGKGWFEVYPFYVIEYLSGGTLRDLLRMQDRIPGTEILSIAGQVADAIDYAHSQGITHRDIKPENILLESNGQGRVVISDFGVAKIIGALRIAPSMAITTNNNQQFAGTPAYVAPEVIQGKQIDFSADIYSFGAVLFEMICKKRPFKESETIWEILNAKTQQNAPDINQYRRVSEKISDRLAITLSRTPTRRPKSARAVLEGIESEIRKL